MACRRRSVGRAGSSVARAILRPVLLALCLAGLARAEDWHHLNEAGIAAALASRVVRHEDGTVQNYFRDGRILREAAGRSLWGRWWVERGRVCALWPPSDQPDCAVVALRGIDLRFTGPDGRVSLARYQDL